MRKQNEVAGEQARFAAGPPQGETAPSGGSAAHAVASVGATLQLAEQLIARPSVTPEDGGCQELIAQRLKALGFQCETMLSGPADFLVTNLWAKLAATTTPTAKTIVFAGHTDVVPTGPLNEWISAPFRPSHRDGKLYGRSSSHMKVSLAAFYVAM